MSNLPPMLVFEDTGRHRVAQVGWAGPWPPPIRMAIATGKETSYQAFMEMAPNDTDAEEAVANARSIADVVIYCRENYSKLPDDLDAITKGFVVKGAIYVEEQ